MWKKVVIIVGMMLCIAMMVSGCNGKKDFTKKVRDIDYTVVEQGDLPKDLRKAIEEKKENGFKLTYAKGDDLYIVIGFGEKKSGGYCVQVKELYLTHNAIVFQTELIGPKSSEVVSQGKSYPMIAVKTEFLDYSVIFD